MTVSHVLSSHQKLQCQPTQTQTQRGCGGIFKCVVSSRLKFAAGIRWQGENIVLSLGRFVGYGEHRRRVLHPKGAKTVKACLGASWRHGGLLWWGVQPVAVKTG